ncbi:MAG: hypothetical protein EA409_12135 [Saprospirales bacterium]|nr:MAG: hypothetical protein EA409_12135 [Saprospirales bacterium]
MKAKGSTPPKLKKLVRWVERAIIIALIAVMSLLLLIATVELIYTVFLALMETDKEMLLVDLDNLLNIFGVFLLVLIGIELLDTIKVYFKENVIHVEVVILVALIAIARKVIVLEFEDYTGSEILGISAIIIALAAAYYLIKKTGSTGLYPKHSREVEEVVVEEQPDSEGESDSRVIKKVKKKKVERPVDQPENQKTQINPKKL